MDVNEELVKVKKDLYLKAATEYFDRYGYKSFNFICGLKFM